MKTVLITGGAGYIGSILVYSLIDSGYNVVVIDNTSIAGAESLLNLWDHSRFKFYKGDVRDKDCLNKIFSENGIDHVIHLAAIVGDPACAKQPELAKDVNWNGSLNVYDIAKSSNVNKFVFASTCSNYGKMAEGDSYVDENSTLAPVSLYAELKVKFENYIVNDEKRAEGFSPVSLRFATVYGISPRMRFDLTVNEFTKELALDRELEVFGDQFWRPYCHVSDFARAITNVIESDNDKVAYNVFNVGNTGENYQKRTLAEMMKKEIPEAKVKYVHKDEDPRDYKVSFEKIKKVLGFETSKTVADGIKEVNYIVRNGIITDPDSIKYRNC
jgi:nucleoside-diphosphate-sugar epimerase